MCSASWEMVKQVWGGSQFLEEPGILQNVTILFQGIDEVHVRRGVPARFASGT